MAENVLGTIFSRADALKRQLYDMIRNPSDYASMVGGRTQENMAAAQALQNEAFADPQNPLRITNPQALSQLTQMITSGPMGFAPAGITAFHGSPYLFRQFDPAKIGSGEGAQVYGVGAGYTAEARPVAEGYRQQISKYMFETGDKNVFDPSKLEHLNIRVRASRGDLEGAIKKAEEVIASKSPSADMAARDLSVLRSLQESGGMKLTEGYLYKGDIPDEILPKFLDWDKSFKEQTSEVKDAIQKYWKENNVYGDPTKLSGAGVYDSVVAHLFEDAGRTGSQKAASNALESIGIRGIRYLDQGSRGEGKGTSNFIPFRAEDYKIQEINDTPIEDYIAKGLL